MRKREEGEGVEGGRGYEKRRGEGGKQYHSVG